MPSGEKGFRKGTSGNPAGPPKGHKKKATIKREELSKMVIESGPKIVRKAIKMANEGDASMIKLLMDKILPTLKAAEIEQTNYSHIQFNTELKIEANDRSVEK